MSFMYGKLLFSVLRSAPFLLDRPGTLDNTVPKLKEPRCGLRKAQRFRSPNKSLNPRPQTTFQEDRNMRNALAHIIAGFLLFAVARSEEHTSELQSLRHLVCRLLLEK